ncbi:hypothetical protein JCM8547_004336 [Rhodosporidiobolus lusitaniae]
MGFDLDRFTEDLPDHLTCPVCFEAASDPYTVCGAEHSFCRDCVVELYHSTQPPAAPTCPTCRLPFQPKPSILLKRALDEYKVGCQWDKEGCTWIGSLSDAKRHEEQECDHRPVKCNLCSASHKHCKAATHHAVCPNVSLACPRGGKDCGGIAGNGLYLRRNEVGHAARCGEFICHYGCGTRTTSCNLPSHERFCLTMQQLQANYQQANANWQQVHNSVTKRLEVALRRNEQLCAALQAGGLAIPTLTPLPFALSSESARSSSVAPFTLPRIGASHSVPSASHQRAHSGSTSSLPSLDLTGSTDHESEEDDVVVVISSGDKRPSSASPDGASLPKRFKAT